MNKEDLKVVFSINFKNALKDKGIKQVELSKAIGVSERSISKLANGETLPRAFLLLQIADYIGVSTDYLLGIEAR